MSDNLLDSRAMTLLEFRLFRDLIYEHCGIFLPENVAFLLERRLKPRLKFAEVRTFREYYQRVKFGRYGYAELCEIIERITTNETYFFREEFQLRDFMEDLVPEFLKRKGDEPIRIWSAGCSSGEEPFSLVMLLKEAGYYDESAFQVLGVDISQQVIEKAREGIYRENAFRETTPARLDKYFAPVGSRYQLGNDIREAVDFKQVNLMEPKEVEDIPRVDIIFCRNVMIYFSQNSRRHLLNTFYDKLNPGGYLLLGHSETLPPATTRFEYIPLKRGIVYRKPT